MNKLSTSTNLIVAFGSSLVLAYYAFVYIVYNVQISNAPFGYRVIWYLILGGCALICVGSLSAGVRGLWRRE